MQKSWGDQFYLKGHVASLFVEIQKNFNWMANIEVSSEGKYDEDILEGKSVAMDSFLHWT